MRTSIATALLLLISISSFAQEDKREVRSGNGNFKRGGYKKAEIDYRKALVKDSTSFVANYDLASSLYMQKDYESASNYLKKVEEQAADHASADRYYFNSGDVALQKKDYAAAVEAFRQSLLKDPSDLQAKESYIYAKKMMENQLNQQDQQGDGEGQNDQNNQNNQNEDKNQDQNQNQKQDQDQNQNQDREQQNQPQISPQQAQQMLKAIQEKEKDTQEKVEKAKAVQAKSRQKEKNW